MQQGYGNNGEPSGYLEVFWCGEHGNAELILNGQVWRKWRTRAANPIKLKVPADYYESILVRVYTENGVDEGLASAFIQNGGYAFVEVGLPYDAIVDHPAGLTQFSFDGGRSACTFLCVAAASLLRDRFAVGRRPDSDVCPVTPGDVSAVLEDGMRRFAGDAGGGAGGFAAAAAAAGLEHTGVAEVLALSPELGAEWEIPSTGVIWGSLADPPALERALAALLLADPAPAGAGIRDPPPPPGPGFAVLTRPPESYLLVREPETGRPAGRQPEGGGRRIGVLDTHGRAVGAARHPAAYYSCPTVAAAAALLRTAFVGLPEGLDAEDLGHYALFELSLLRSTGCTPGGRRAEAGAATAPGATREPARPPPPDFPGRRPATPELPCEIPAAGPPLAWAAAPPLAGGDAGRGSPGSLGLDRLSLGPAAAGRRASSSSAAAAAAAAAGDGGDSWVCDEDGEAVAMVEDDDSDEGSPAAAAAAPPDAVDSDGEGDVARAGACGPPLSPPLAFSAS